MGECKSERCLTLAELELDTCWDWHPCSSTQDTMNTHKHWSQQPIRRSAPVDDDRQMPDWKQHERKSCKGTLTFYTETPDPTEQAARRCHCGNKHEPSYKGNTMLLGMSKNTYHTQESFTLPCIPFFIYSFHLHNLLTGALYK